MIFKKAYYWMKIMLPANIFAAKKVYAWWKTGAEPIDPWRKWRKGNPHQDIGKWKNVGYGGKFSKMETMRIIRHNAIRQALFNYKSALMPGYRGPV